MYKNKKIHLIGIGGVSMSGLARILKDMGALITGSDSNQSIITDELEKHGINVTIGHNIENIKNADIIIYTAAINKNDIELKYAIDNNIENYERAKFLGLISKNYENTICIAGTHGKSTTTGLVSNIFLTAKLNPTITIGAHLPSINGNIHIGDKKYLIMESCEYVDSFLNFYPTSAIITNIDNDHLDYFEDINAIKKSFKNFTNLIPESGIVVINNDDENSEILNETKANKITYGIKKTSNYHAKNITYNNQGQGTYDLYKDNELITTINLGISGSHNIYNSLAAIALSSNYNINIEDIKNGIESYQGVGRRFEFLGNYNEALIYDDYAHHPTEIITTYESTEKIKAKKTIAIFQGHTYSRTKEHLIEFANTLANFDEIIIAPIYPAREENIYNIKEEDLVNLIKEKNNNVIYIDTFEKIIFQLKQKAQKGDLIISIGAGPVNEITKTLTNNQ